MRIIPGASEIGHHDLEVAALVVRGLGSRV